MSNFMVKQGRQAVYEDLAGIIRLDRLVYPEKYWTILDYAVRWHKKNSDIFTFLFDGSEMAGYICFMPVEDTLYNAIRDGSVVQDVTIPLEKVLEYIPGSSYSLYVFSVVLHPKYHGTDAVKYLLEGAFQNLLDLKRQGINFDKVLADAVSPKGEKLLKSLGFDKVCSSNHDSTIFENTVQSMLSSFKHKSNK